MRRASRLVAVVLLLASARGLPHLAQDDFACVPSALSYAGPHDESQHGLQPAGAAHEQEHCAVCHWTRSLRSPRAHVAGSAASEHSASAVHGAASSAPLAPALDNLPARAPPSSL